MDFKALLEHHVMDHVWARLSVGPMSLPISRHLLMMWIAGVLLTAVAALAARGKNDVAVLLRGAFEAITVYIKDEVVLANMGEEGWIYLPYFLTLFFFLLFCGLLGLVPFGATATGNISVTATLALTTFFLIHAAGITHHGLGHYVSSLIPHGLPIWLVPLMFVVEMIGFVTKCFALCIRLFMNMIAGHIVVLAFLTLIFLFGALNPWVGLVLTAPFSVLSALFVYLLEIFVVFLQAYIFTFLTALFVGAAIHPQH